MKTLKIYSVLCLIMLSSSAWSAIYWVGNSTACTGSNVYGSLLQALLVSGGSGDPADEIRLTNTVNYIGNTNGNYTLTDRDSTGAGVLTIVGGYPDCFGAVNGRTFIGDTSNEIFEVITSNESSSVVTFRNIQMSSASATRALILGAGAVVTLDNVLVSSNQSGITVSGGGYLEVLANSLIQFNGNTTNILGGGIYCTGFNSSVVLRGRLHRNQGLRGGNLHIRSGCYLEIKDGVRVEGRGTLAGLDAVDGGGLYVDNGGEVFADGRANRVIFDGNVATEGGAIYVNGTGFVLLQNTHINGSEAEDGAAIFAKDGGGTLQLIMDQTTDCNLLFRCSEIQNARYERSVVAVENSMIQLQRTVIELSEYTANTPVAIGLITTNHGSQVRLNRVAMIRNSGNAMLRSDNNNDEFLVSHLTMSENNIPNSASNSYLSVILAGSIDVQNSLITDSSGIDNRTGGVADISGKCNLIDDDTDWPSGLYHLGNPQLVNPAAGDARQLAGSLGVDMCLQDTFTWSSEIDIENQAAAVNENTNPQGQPGQAGGLYDAGFDEVYDNIGNDEFLLTIEKEGPGEGVVISNPSGISCGVDCSEVFFNGTIVTLFASPVTGNEFIGWLNCPLVNQDDECLTSVESSHTIRAVFAPDDLIFYDGFD